MLRQRGVTRREAMRTIVAAPIAASAAAASPITFDRILRPARLRAGMTVGLCSPASNAPEDESIEAAADFLRSLDFRVKPARHLFERNQYLAGTDTERAADLNALFRDDDVDAVWCLRGGYGTMRILPALDFEAIRRNPKALIGYSDITALHNAVLKHAGVGTIHGPIAGANFTDYTYDQYRRVLVEPRAPVRIAEPPPFDGGPGIVDRTNRVTTLVGGRAEGPLIGGNLTLLVHLLGTPYEPDFRGAILFVEDVYEAPYSIDRMLTHLWLAGRLQQCAGIAFGMFTDAAVDGNSFSVEQVLRDRIAPLEIPCVRGLMIGHVADQTFVPMGARARLDADTGELTLLEAGVS